MRRCGWHTGGLCDLLGIPRRTFYRIIEESLGVPCKRWLREHRMVDARHLLREDWKILALARHLRFRDECDFIREFKAWYGIPPGRFARLQRCHHQTEDDK